LDGYSGFVVLILLPTHMKAWWSMKYNPFSCLRSSFLLTIFVVPRPSILLFRDDSRRTILQCNRFWRQDLSSRRFCRWPTLRWRKCLFIWNVHVSAESYMEVKFWTIQWYGPWLIYNTRNIAIMIVMTIIICAFHLLAAHYIPAQRSKGDMIRFQRHRRKRRVSPDSENGTPLTFSPETNGQSRGAANFHGKPESNPNFEAIKKQSSVFHWKNLSYEIKVQDGTKRILNDIDGWVKPGTLTALMVCYNPQLWLRTLVNWHYSGCDRCR